MKSITIFSLTTIKGVLGVQSVLKVILLSIANWLRMWWNQQML